MEMYTGINSGSYSTSATAAAPVAAAPAAVPATVPVPALGTAVPVVDAVGLSAVASSAGSAGSMAVDSSHFVATHETLAEPETNTATVPPVAVTPAGPVKIAPIIGVKRSAPVLTSACASTSAPVAAATLEVQGRSLLGSKGAEKDVQPKQQHNVDEDIPVSKVQVKEMSEVGVVGVVGVVGAVGADAGDAAAVEVEKEIYMNSSASAEKMIPSKQEYGDTHAAADAAMDVDEGVVEELAID